jgi:hypothetical protein
VRIISIAAIAMVSLLQLAANWTPAETDQITTRIQQQIPNWTREHTVSLARDSDRKGVRMELVYGHMFQVMGNTVLLDGKDVSGNLGSNTTYGDNSPIIEGAIGSQIAVGDGARAEETNITLLPTLSISLAATLGVTATIYLLWRRRRSPKASAAS